MTEAEGPIESDDVPIDVPKASETMRPRYDRFLEIIVRGLDNGEMQGLGLTLNVAGAIISGRAVGTQEYLRKAGRQFGGPNDEDATAMERSFESLWPKERELKDNDRVAYVHLVDARAFSGAGALPSTGPGGCWRVRLDQVAAFMFGSMTPQ